MLTSHIIRLTPIRMLGTLMAVGLTMVSATRAEAQVVHTYPGSSCQASASAQDLYYSGQVIANRTAATKSAVCPFVRTNGVAGWNWIQVFVRDRHSTQNVTCVAQARDLFGTPGVGWSDTRSSVGEGDQTIFFPGPGVAPPFGGPYTITCSIPPMEEANQPSYISSLRIAEP